MGTKEKSPPTVRCLSGADKLIKSGVGAIWCPTVFLVSPPPSSSFVSLSICVSLCLHDLALEYHPCILRGERYTRLLCHHSQGQSGGRKVFEIQIESRRAAGQSIVGAGNMNLLEAPPPQASWTSWQGRTKPAFTTFASKHFLLRPFLHPPSFSMGPTFPGHHFCLHS